MDDTGDTTVSWDPNVPQDVEIARGVFDRYMTRGYMAVSMGIDGSTGSRIAEFDPTAGSILMVPPVRGG